jgi:hypothetical protein
MKQLSLLTFLLTTFLAHGQTRTITGKILYDELSPAYEAIILTSDTVQLGKTDKNGDFKIDVPAGINKLKIALIGMEMNLIEVPPTCDRLEIIMMPAGNYDYKSHKKIDRIRKSLFNKLIGQHLLAFDIGLFTTQSPCYQREFEPIKPRLDEIRKERNAKEKEIKKAFRELQVGDTVRIPYSTTFRYDGTDRTSLHVYSYIVDGENFKCIIQGVIIDKSQNYEFTYRVTNSELCNLQSTIYQNMDMSVGQVFKHNMRYYKVLTK